MYSSTQSDEGRLHGPRVRQVIEAALTGISGMLFVYFLLSVVWLSSLRGSRNCGGRHGLGSRLGLLGLFVFRFLLLGFD